MLEFGRILGDRCPVFTHLMHLQATAWGSKGNKSEVVEGLEPGRLHWGPTCFRSATTAPRNGPGPCVIRFVPALASKSTLS